MPWHGRTVRAILKYPGLRQTSQRLLVTSALLAIQKLIVQRDQVDTEVKLKEEAVDIRETRSDVLSEQPE